MTTNRIFFLAGILLFSQSISAQEVRNNSVVSLFNGKNLDGWYQIANDQGTEKNLFTVEKGMVRTYASQKAGSQQSFGALITNQEYENYELNLEYKWGEKKFKPRENDVRDAGVLFHIFGEEIIWPGGIECQIQEGDTGDLWIVKARASTKIDPYRRNFDPKGIFQTIGNSPKEFNKSPRSFCWEQPGWNKVRILVKGDFAQFFINDKLVNEAIDMKRWDENKKEWVSLTKGKILLQAEGSEIFYRNITIQSLN